jgi:proteasome accessory factor B
MGDKIRHSRPPLARMIGIHELLQGGQKTNCRTLATLLEVSPKTIQRDIDFMRDQLGLPIEYDVTTHSYSYTCAVAQFPGVLISEGELVALSVAKRALSQYVGTPFQKPLHDALDKLAAGVRGLLPAASDGDGTESFSFRASGQSTGDPGIFEAASESVLRREEIEFRYRKLGDDGCESRRVQPLHLACIEQQWYLYAVDLQRAGKVRTFALARISDLVRSGRHFTREEPFSLEDHLAGSFGVFSCTRPERIELRFDELGARLVRDRVWHTTQNIEPLAEGGCRFSLHVGISPEIERWILGWGAHVEVLAPVALREAIAAQTLRAATRYRASE